MTASLQYSSGDQTRTVFPNGQACYVVISMSVIISLLRPRLLIYLIKAL